MSLRIFPLAKRVAHLVGLLSRLPLLMACYYPQVREAVERDIVRVSYHRLDLPSPARADLDMTLRALGHRPFRTVLFARLSGTSPQGQIIAAALGLIYRQEAASELHCRQIGAGLYFDHMFATIVIARSIGNDCQIGQQTTIGYSDAGGPPIIGDRVRVGANAVVIGPVTLGDDCVVGAGSVVVRDVAPGVVVGGVPAAPLSSAQNRFARGGPGSTG